MHRESAFHPCAVSDKGALGLMQLMPATIAQFHVSDPFDPAQSVHAGAKLVRSLLDKYQGDLRLTLAAYNAGSSRIANADPDNYPAETKNYIAISWQNSGSESESQALNLLVLRRDFGLGEWIRTSDLLVPKSEDDKDQ